MLYLKKKYADTLVGVWKLDESTDQLVAMLTDDASIQDILLINAPNRIREMLAVRVLLKELIGTQKRINYYGSGRPHLADDSFRIGISHTKGYVAIALHPHQKIGLDIEHISDKVRKVKTRLIAPNEYIDPTQELVHLLLHWSIKEAIYKVLDKTKVDFLEHLHVKPFAPLPEGICEATETKTMQQHSFDTIHYLVQPQFVLVCLVVD